MFYIPLAIMVQSPLLSVYRVAFNFRFTLPGDMFPNVDRIRQVRCPVFVIHGTRDEIVPFRNGEVKKIYGHHTQTVFMCAQPIDTT